MEYDEKYHIAQEEHNEKACIAFKEQIRHINATWMAKVGMLQNDRSIRQKPDQYRKMEPEPEKIKMTANAEASPINSEVLASVTKKRDNFDQPGKYLNNILVGTIIMAESVCNSISLEKEIGSWSIEMLSYEKDKPWDIDMRVEGVMVNVSSENVRCEATHTFQELSTADASIELDVVNVSSANIVLEEKFGEEVFPEEIRNNTYRSKMINLVYDSSVNIIFEERFERGLARGSLLWSI